jgi:protein-S-isoprenylcysteine O-methyltransferase Ste14
MTRRPSLMRWTAPAVFGLAAASIGAHTEGELAHALAQQSTRSWLLVVYGLLRTCVFLAFAVFTVGRGAPRRHSRSPLAFLACAAALGTVLAFGDPAPNTPEAVLLAGEALTLASCTWLLTSVLFLGRCFGVLPEARGLVTRGPYRLVRHPVYLGEIGACVGLAVAAPSVANAVAVAAVIAAQTVRMHLEERALSDAFPEYASYASRTPRLIPRLQLAGADHLIKLARVPTIHRRSPKAALPSPAEPASNA